MRATARLEKGLRAAAARGWDAVIVARPGGGETRILESKSVESVDELVQRVRAATKEGLVKVTLRRADGSRVSFDARHGSAHEVDATAAAEKAMAGKSRSLRPDAHGPLLRALGIENADGTISAQNAKKYKQVSHLVELLRPAWTAAAKRGITEENPLRVLDLACGNAYLGFVLAQALLDAGIPFRIHGIDVREDLVARCAERAANLGFPGLSFSRSSIAEAAGVVIQLGGQPDLVLALHACDTATDEALAVADSLHAASVFVVPCCQAEIAVQLRRSRGGPTPAYRHGLLLREHAATLTDALRVDWLEARGFDVDVLEFVEAGHTPKNRLLRGERRREPDLSAMTAWADRCAALGVAPAALPIS